MGRERSTLSRGPPWSNILITKIRSIQAAIRGQPQRTEKKPTVRNGTRRRPIYVAIAPEVQRKYDCDGHEHDKVVARIRPCWFRAGVRWVWVHWERENAQLV